MPTRSSRFLACAFLLSAASLSASDGAPDTTFSAGGYRVVESTLGPDAGSLSLTATGVLADGRLLGAGWVASAEDDNAAVTLMGDGGVTTTCIRGFESSVADHWDDRTLSALVQPDGKIVVAGWVEGADGNPDRQPMVMRLLADGCSYDSNFGTAGRKLLDFGAPGEIRALALQPDGRIVVAGIRSLDATTRQGVITRLLTDGQVDPSVPNTGNRVILAPPNTDQLLLNALALGPGGRIVVAGSRRSTIDGNVDLYVASRLANVTADSQFSNGELWTAIDHGGSLIDTASGVVVLPDQRVVVVGSADKSTGSAAVALVYEPNGDLDTSFGTGGLLSTSFVSANHRNAFTSIARQIGGHLVAAGWYGVDILLGDTEVGVIRFWPDGALPQDPDFGTGGVQTMTIDEGGLNLATLNAVTVGQGGRISAVGTASVPDGTGALGLRLRSGIFADGFETANTVIWSAEVP